MESLSNIKQGNSVSDTARTKYEIVGNWEEVLSSDKLDVFVDGQVVKWSEGPLWMQSEGAFYFSSPLDDKIWKLTSGNSEGTETPLLQQIWATQAGGIDPKDHPTIAEPGGNGMAADPNDTSLVYICQQGKRRIIRCRLPDHLPGAPLEKCPGFEVIADLTPNGRRFNSPNDIIVAKNSGNVWFTDPIYGLLEKNRCADYFDAKEGSYLDNKCHDEGAGVKGVYCWNIKTRNVELVTAFHRRPNGLALTPDESSLWVADSSIGCPSWTKYDVVTKEDGSTTLGPCAKQVITPAILGAVLGTTEQGTSLLGVEGLSDGFKIDEKGRIWTSIPNGFAIIDPDATEKLICQILLGVNTSNVAFGRSGDVFLTGEGVWRMKRKLT